MKNMRTCVSPDGCFVYGIHRPGFLVKNLRGQDRIYYLGAFEDGVTCGNQVNFPKEDIEVQSADAVIEIPNPFPFRGVTYINTRWANENAKAPAESIRLAEAPGVSFSSVIAEWNNGSKPPDREKKRMLKALPEPLQLALAETGTDPDDLVRLAHMACDFIFDSHTGRPEGLVYIRDKSGRAVAKIHKPTLFEVLANNPHLPADYREVMVLRPGVQGANEIVGEYIGENGTPHVYEYLRSNSYIPWGHYAANMAEDSIRYSAADLAEKDMHGMRHLYYQRTYVRLAQDLDVNVKTERRQFSEDELEALRLGIMQLLSDEKNRESLAFNRTLWGWNYGFDYAPTKYRLHASHQQIHHQYAMIPKAVSSPGGPARGMASYAAGDLVEEFISEYRDITGVCFFDAYIHAIENNRRIEDSGRGESSLVVYSDENVIVFVPKAQTSQWELQVMARPPVGNIVEAETGMRRSLDKAILEGAKALCRMGARMITFYEISKRMDSEDQDQRLLYTILPRLPESPGAFSESQLRWINGHYPEDFATACRQNFFAF
ncbi:MAG: hypothetical protein K9J85_07285 [Desulfobacteraceae bacterium]|nr:hypothetical protein [Desulfobacteraceae bacterium]